MTPDVPVLQSDSPATTETYGAGLGAVLRRGDVLVLEGPLGAGKTCLVRGIVAGAGGDASSVRSPTFVLHQPHPGGLVTVHHLDLYRLGPGASVDVLDLDTLLVDGAAVIEWGGFAELGHLQPCTVLIEGGDSHPDHRVLRLIGPAQPHLAAAWRALQERVAAP
ncbi:MAG TPA: tRNA (adenosine(37)-N6)-threonylcarbamoyltransferase complex ATPase subunit type 1 TsaE [Candidatus Dormibacteraeota bacterium]|jgi:tRNA threonylcarbamoyladenosine biosynthesis protein TsaE|nr:tRNA (adenosine(37)-N6)-threonylcarbamoyltransferase complex ATPase subunit type 1 TsaE [Candidatus Dormibacteraeota bacterium]